LGFVHVFFNSASFELIAGLVPRSAARFSPGGIIRAKDQPIAFLFACARHRIPAKTDELRRIPGTFSFTGGISLRGRSMMLAAGISLGAIRSKNESITFLLAGAYHRLPARAYKLRLIPGAFTFAGGIRLRGRTVMPSARFLRGCIISECINGDEDSQQSDNDGCFFCDVH
jgi:hypothetical protein